MESIRFVHAADLHIDSPFAGIREADPRIAKLRQLKTQLLGGDQSAAVIAVATDYNETTDQALARLRSFVSASASFEHIVTRPSPEDKVKIAKTACPGGEPCAE